MQPNFRTPITLVVNSIDDRKFSRLTSSLRNVSGGMTYPIVKIPDAKSMAEGLNRGASLANTPFLAFCHDDIEFLSPFPMRSIGVALQYYDVVGLAGTDLLLSGNWYDAGQPHLQGAVVSPVQGRFELQIFGVSQSAVHEQTQALDGIFIACRRELFDRFGGFDQDTFTEWHGYDVDFTHRAYLSGAKLCTAIDVLVYHASHPAEFNDEKLHHFEAAQAIIERKYLEGRKRQGACRNHTNLAASSLKEAYNLWRHERLINTKMIET